MVYMDILGMYLDAQVKSRPLSMMGPDTVMNRQNKVPILTWFIIWFLSFSDKYPTNSLLDIEWVSYLLQSWQGYHPSTDMTYLRNFVCIKHGSWAPSLLDFVSNQFGPIFDGANSIPICISNVWVVGHLIFDFVIIS